MSDDNWNEVIKAEDRRIENADRKHRYHFYSLEGMSEELVYQESITRHNENDPTDGITDTSLIDRIQDKKLANALRQLTPKQQKVIELAYWQGYKHWEIAEIMGCKRHTATELLARALKKLDQILAE